MSADFFCAESKKNVGRHFSGEDFVDVTRRGRLRPDATKLTDVLKAFRQGGLRRPQVVSSWVEHFIESLEEQVRRYPTNSNEYFFWEELDGLVA